MGVITFRTYSYAQNNSTFGISLNLPPSLILRENNSFNSVNCYYNKELCTKISSPLIEIECFSREEENQ